MLVSPHGEFLSFNLRNVFFFFERGMEKKRLYPIAALLIFLPVGISQKTEWDSKHINFAWMGVVFLFLSYIQY